MNDQKKEQNSNHLTVPVVISYPNTLFKAKSFMGGVPKHSLTVLYHKDNKDEMADLKMFKVIADRIVAENWPDENTRPKHLVYGGEKSIIKDADTCHNEAGQLLSEKDPPYKGCYIIRPNRREDQGAPVVVDRERNPLINRAVIYGGCKCRVNMNPYYYELTDDKGKIIKRGVAVGLNGVWFWEDGEAFGNSRMSNEEMFGVPDNSSDDFGSADTFGNNDDIAL